MAGFPVRQHGHQLLILQECMHIMERGIDDPQVPPGCPDGRLCLVDGQLGGTLYLYCLVILADQLPVLVGPTVDQRMLFQLS